METYEIIYAKQVEADNFFDAVEKAKEEGLEVLSVLTVSSENEYVYD